MSNILHRSFTTELPEISSGNGIRLTDTNGKTYIDACGGVAVSCLGHSNHAVTQAIAEQLNTVSYIHNGFFTNKAAEELATRLITAAPKGFGDGRAMFLGSGSEAMEAALKLARQYHLERGDKNRTRIIARRSSFHGNTLGALAIGGHKGRRAPFAPLLIDAEHIDPCYSYRHQHPGESEQQYGLRAANLLEEKIKELGAETVAAFAAEPIVGATLGTVPAAQGYFRRIREICDQYGVLFIADEVMCGMGRTGTIFALEQEGISPDIITVAKGLGAGYQPIAAVLASEGICQAIETGSGTLWNGHTYMSHSVACAGALAVMKEIETHQLMNNTQAMGAVLERRLRELFQNHPHVGDIRGRGLFWTLELVADKDSKTPFPAERRLWAQIRQTAFKNGLMCYPSTGCVDGVNGDHVLLAPPYNVTEAEINEVCTILQATLQQCLGE